MKAIKKFLAVSSILVASSVATASSGQVTEYFCNNANGWIRLTIEPGNSKLSHGKFDTPIFEKAVPDKAIKTVDDPNGIIRILNYSSSEGDKPGFFLYARVSNIDGTNWTSLYFENEDGSTSSFAGGLTCKMFE